MVAAAGETSAFSAAQGTVALALIIVGPWRLPRCRIARSSSPGFRLDKTVDALEDRARDIVAKLGYTERPADTAHGLFVLQ